MCAASAKPYTLNPEPRSLHEKNGALDQTLHFLLAQACWAGALFSALEVAWPSSVLLSTGRIGSMLLQGTWFCQSARVLFEGGWLGAWVGWDGWVGAARPLGRLAPAWLVAVGWVVVVGGDDQCSLYMQPVWWLNIF